MELVETPMNIINVPQGWYLAHAISADLNFDVGLPKVFNNVFDLENKIDDVLDDVAVGQVAVVANSISLIVKESTYDIVDINDLSFALLNLRVTCEALKITKLAIPKLCCGRNGLLWEDVKDIIEKIFENSDIFIMVCIY
jgi:hypothetical protein